MTTTTATLSCSAHHSGPLWPLGLQECLKNVHKDPRRVTHFALQPPRLFATMTLAALPPRSLSDPALKWSDIFSDSEDESEEKVVRQPQAHLTNRFVEALTDAARHYLEKPKLPSVIESKLDRANVRVEDLEDVPEEHFSDSDEESDQATKLTSLDTKDTMSVFYKPVGEWASLASQPIENARVIKTLHAGAMCEAFIKRGSIAGREITYISKTWILNQRWEGFFSEVWNHPLWQQNLLLNSMIVDGALFASGLPPTVAGQRYPNDHWRVSR